MCFSLFLTPMMMFCERKSNSATLCLCCTLFAVEGLDAHCPKFVMLMMLFFCLFYLFIYFCFFREWVIESYILSEFVIFLI